MNPEHTVSVIKTPFVIGVKVVRFKRLYIAGQLVNI